MLIIRFSRVGRRNRPQFRIVVQENTVAPTGRHVEILGSYDPKLKNVALKTERVNYWIGQGAQMSDTAYNLFVKEGIIKGEKRAMKTKKAEVVEGEGELAKEEAPTKEEEKKPETAKDEAPVAKEEKSVKEVKEDTEKK